MVVRETAKVEKYHSERKKMLHTLSPLQCIQSSVIPSKQAELNFAPVE